MQTKHSGSGADIASRAAALAIVAAAATTLGCGDASGQITGGEPLLLVAPSDGGEQLPADCTGDGGHAGNGWNDLYTCYFGPTGIASCAFATGCHGSSSDYGVSASGGFLCPPDGDAGTCYAGITPSIVPAGGAADPTTTTLYKVLRKTGVPQCTARLGSCMPLAPATVVFTQRDVDRISSWIEAGARND